MLADHFPLLGLRLRTPRLELRMPEPEELAELAELAVRGIHEPGTMPFLVPWTEQEPALVARAVVQYQWLKLGDWTPDDWIVNFAVFRDGEVVGQQTMRAHHFVVTREVHTGSWVGRRYQGQGIGTEMRAAVLHLAFAGLGAEDAASGAFEDNAASLAVSRKFGYQEDGIARHAVRDALAVERRLRLSRAAWRDETPVTIEGLEPCLPLFGI